MTDALAAGAQTVTLTGSARQACISPVMETQLNPEKSAAYAKAHPCAAPRGWTYRKVTLGGVPCERLAPAWAKTQRVFLQLHGGGYVAGMSDGCRRLGIRQARMTDAKEVWFVNYRLAPQHV